MRQFDKGLTGAKTALAVQQERAATADARAKDADARIAEAQRGSAEANERATKAQESLALAEQHSAEANAKAEGFRLDIAKANEGTARITKENLVLQAEVLRLSQGAAPRRLTEAQKLDLVDKLSKVPAFTVSFEPASSNGTAEAFNFTDDLIDVFVRMKLITAGPPTGQGTISLTPSRGHGVVIGIRSRSERPDAALVFGNALIAMGFEASLEEAPQRGLSGTAMIVLVGPKQ